MNKKVYISLPIKIDEKTVARRYKEALDLYMQIRDDIDVIEEIKSCEDWLQWQHKDNIISNIIGIPMLIIFLGGVLIFIIALIKNIFKTIF